MIPPFARYANSIVGNDGLHDKTIQDDGLAEVDYGVLCEKKCRRRDHADCNDGVRSA